MKFKKGSGHMPLRSPSSMFLVSILLTLFSGATLSTSALTTQNLAAAGNGFAGLARVPEIESEWNDKALDTLLAGYSGPQPGAAIMIAKGDQLLACRGYGLAMVDPAVPVTADTRFRIASVSKIFTATAVLMLVEAEELSLESTLTEVFPDFPDYGASITIFHLLTHQSGLPGYEPLADATTDGSQLTDADVLAYLKTLEVPSFLPGDKFSYSNAAYAVLAEVVAAVSERPFEEFMNSEVFEPLGMHSTGYIDITDDIPTRALGYRILEDRPVVSDQTQSTAIRGDGSIYTSARDFFRWHISLNEFALVSEEMQARIYAAQEGTDGQYGFGWFVPRDPEAVDISHGGASFGFVAYVRRIPEREITVAVFANRDRSAISQRNQEPDRISLALLSLATDGKVPMPSMEED